MTRRILAAGAALIAAGSFFFAAAPAHGHFKPNDPAETVTEAAKSAPVGTSSHTDEPQVMVIPRRALFDVKLTPGDAEYRTFTATNNGKNPIRLSLTAVQTAWSGHPTNPRHLLFSVKRQGDTTCTRTNHPAATWVPLEEVNALDRGQLKPQQSERYCAAITLPVDTDLSAPARSDVDFLLDAITAPPLGGENHGELAFTGANLSRLLLIALGVTSTGATVLLLRRRPTAGGQAAQYP